MIPRRLAQVFRRDLAHNLRRPLFWVWIVLVVFMAWSMSTGNARIQSGDSSVGGTKTHITSEFAVTMQLAVLIPLIHGFFVSVAAGMTVIHDDELRVGELLHATPLRPAEYVWGKYLAVLATALLALAIHIGAMILCNHATPAASSQEFRGPFHLVNYVRPALLFGVPTVVFFAGLSFLVGERSRKPVLVFSLPVAVLLGCIFFLWEWAPVWLSPQGERILQLVDPAGFRWLNKTLLEVDRGVRYYNSARVPLDAVIAINRLVVLALGVGAVLWAARHFSANLRGLAPGAERAWRAGRVLREAAGLSAEQVVASAAPASRPLGALGMATRPPGWFAGAWTVLGAELSELRSSPGLYLFIPLLVLEALVPTLIATGPFDTPLLITPGTFAARTLNPLTTLLCLLLLFYTVESLGRERHTRLAAISNATPVRTGSILLGKAAAMSLVGVAVLIIQFLVAAVFLAIQGKVRIQLWPFALVWGLLLLPTLLLWTSFVMAALAVTKSRYATYAVAIAVIVFTGFRQAIGEMNWVGNWPLWGAIQWSDISVLEHDRAAIVLNRIMVVGLAAVFIALSARLFGRREADASGLVSRLRPLTLLYSSRWFLAAAFVPFCAGALLWSRIDRGYQGDATKKLEKNYWRKNLATYLDAPVPDVTAVDLAVDLFPASHRLAVEGTYDLLNNQEKPLRQILLTGGVHWESPTWTLEGQPFKPDDRSGLYVFTPPQPLPPGGKTRIGFKFTGEFPRGISRKGGSAMEFILPSGVVLTSFGTSFVPPVGFFGDIGVDDDNKVDSKEYADDYYVGQTESFIGPRRPFKTRIKISGPADLTYNSVGTRTSETVSGKRRTVVWESDQPVNFFNIVAGRWQVREGKGTAVYYDSHHPYNVDEMVAALDAARTYYSAWFRPYPWRELKLSEFPGLATYAQGFPTDITFSESVGFLTRSDPGADIAFMVTAHEAAHQWWGNMITPGKGPGGNLLSEGTAHFSTLLLIEQVKGLEARIDFARKIEDTYGKDRSADSERPLVKIDGTRNGDSTVTYDKTGFVLWMLLNHMGREPLLAGIRDVFAKYQGNPDHPVLQDFLAVVRPHAADPAAFDAFTQQWFFKVVVPEYQLTGAKKARDGAGWLVTGRIENIGTGRMPVELAATTGERFPKKAKQARSTSAKPYRESRQTVILDASQSADVSIHCDFEPGQLVVDPDAKVLMLRRKSATAGL